MVRIGIEASERIGLACEAEVVAGTTVMSVPPQRRERPLNTGQNPRSHRPISRALSCVIILVLPLQSLAPALGIELDTERLQRFRRHLFEFKKYLRNNWPNLTNYAQCLPPLFTHLERAGRIGDEPPGKSENG
jgi:hypothetical protein